MWIKVAAESERLWLFQNAFQFWLRCYFACQCKKPVFILKSSWKIKFFADSIRIYAKWIFHSITIFQSNYLLFVAFPVLCSAPISCTLHSAAESPGKYRRNYQNESDHKLLAHSGYSQKQTFSINAALFFYMRTFFRSYSLHSVYGMSAKFAFNAKTDTILPCKMREIFNTNKCISLSSMHRSQQRRFPCIFHLMLIE